MIIDLTQSISPTLKQFPGSPEVAFIKWSKYEIQGYNLEAMFLSTIQGRIWMHHLILSRKVILLIR